MTDRDGVSTGIGQLACSLPPQPWTTVRMEYYWRGGLGVSAADSAAAEHHCVTWIRPCLFPVSRTNDARPIHTPVDLLAALRRMLCGQQGTRWTMCDVQIFEGRIDLPRGPTLLCPDRHVRAVIPSRQRARSVRMSDSTLLGASVHASPELFCARVSQPSSIRELASPEEACSRSLSPYTGP